MSMPARGLPFGSHVRFLGEYRSMLYSEPPPPVLLVFSFSDPMTLVDMVVVGLDELASPLPFDPFHEDSDGTITPVKIVVDGVLADDVGKHGPCAPARLQANLWLKGPCHFTFIEATTITLR
jgi:hypothetical protein